VTLLDVTRADDRHTSERLSAEPIIWLGTVRPDGRPHNVPVWFAWHDPMVLIFSMPRTAKVADLRLSPAVSLALDSAGGGQDIVLAEGRAELITGADQHPHFLAGKFREKYAPSLGAMSFEQWRSTFSQPLLVHVERIIAWTRTAAGVAYRIVP
jgi:PPOX class probable F420-dependent enzyme